MADQVKGTEEFFLKIVKHAILALMGLALVAIPILLIFGATRFMSSAKEPEPAKKAPTKEVTMDGMQQYLLDLQKRQEEAEKFDPSKKKASEQDQPSAIYLKDALEVFECAEKFAGAANLLVDANRDAKSALEIVGRTREQIEKRASHPGRGGEYVKSLVAFVCKALSDPGVIALRKSEKIKIGVVGATINYHQTAWDSIVQERQKFETSEQSRVAAMRIAEGARIAVDRALGVTALTSAGAAFAAFMLLAIYLILAKIETNMREMNESIRGRTV